MKLQNSVKFTAMFLLITFCLPFLSFIAELDLEGYNALAMNVVPTDITAIYADDFEDGSIDEKINSWNFIASDTVVESDGKLTFTRSETSADEARIDFSTNTENTGVTGKLLIKFTVEKSMDHMRVEIRDNNSTGGTGRLTKLQWEGDTFRVASGAPTGVWTNYPLPTGTGKVDVAVYTEITSGKPNFTLWVDGQAVIEDTPALDNSFDSSKGISCVRMFTLNDNAGHIGEGSYSIDNFGIYTVNSLPEDMTVIYADDFEDGSIDEKINSWNFIASDTVIESDGKLSFTRDESSEQEARIDFSPYTDNTGVTGKLLIKFTVEKTMDHMRVEIRDNNSIGGTGRLTKLQWEGDTFRVASGAPTGVWTNYPLPTGTEKADVEIYTEISTGKPNFTLLVNGETIIEDTPALDNSFDSSKGISCVRMFTLKFNEDFAGVGSYSIDNFGIYALGELPGGSGGGTTPPSQGGEETTPPSQGGEETTPPTQVAVIPTDITAIYADEFADGSIDEKINLWNTIATDTVTESDGKLTFTRSETSSNEARLDFSPNTENTGVTGKLLIKFTVEKTLDTFRVEIRDNNSTGGTGRLTKLQWEGGNFRVASGAPTGVWTNYPLPSGTDKVDVAVYTEIAAGIPSFTLWVNGQAVIEDTPALDNSFDSSKGISCVRMFTLNDNAGYTGVGSYSVDNFGFYTVNNLPDGMTVVYEDDFEDGTMDARIVSSNFLGSDTVAEADGKLTFTRTESSTQEARVDFSPYTDNTGVTGKLLIKFTAEKTMDHMRVEIRDNNSTGGTGRLTKLQWEGDTFRVASGAPTGIWKNHPLPTGTDKLEVEIHTEIEVGKPDFTVIVNGTTIIADTPALDTNFNPVEGIKCIRMFTLNDNVSYEGVGTYSIDDFGIYHTKTQSDDSGDDTGWIPPMTDDRTDEEMINDIKLENITDESPDAIRTSLNLMETTIYGYPITWSSSNTSVITNSGRVIRPRFDQDDAEVTMTATIGSQSKSLTFTVLADEEPADPMYTSDEDFFGVWDGSSYTKGPQLDYSLEGMSLVEAMAKAGNYAAAKDELYNYFLNRDVPSPLSVGSRLPGWVDSRIDGVYSLGEEAAYYRGLANITSDNYELVSVKIFNGKNLSKSKKTFELIARYNESTSAYVLGTAADDPNMVPTLDVTVNGAVRSYKATDTSTIRAGMYSGKVISNHKELKAKMFGDFLGDETYRILLQFDLSDIGSDDTITEAQLNFYAKKSAPYADNKQLYVVDNAGGSWTEDNVYWDKLNFVLHNYNGLVGGCTWQTAKGTDVEYAYQMPRMMHLRSAMTEYKYTGNKKYAYAIITQIMDLITDTKGASPYPRSLDAGLRLQQFVPAMNSVISSPYCTAEFVTTFMKYIYKEFEFFPSRVNVVSNWRDYEQLAVFHATNAYPEAANAASTRDAAIDSWKNAFNKSFLSDGTYVEDTGGYHRSSFTMYKDFKKAAVDGNIELPADFDDTLHKAAYYMRLLMGPNGESLGYGDESVGSFGSGSYKEVAQWYNDYELQFIDSLYTEGIEPSWTSYQFPVSTLTMMRSDWKRDAHYLFTNVRGNSAINGHGQPDDNGIIYFAHGKRMLVDAGRFTYTGDDPARQYAMSTQGHNTVVIDDSSQRHTDNKDTNVGTINTWTTNSEFDFSSQTSIAYADNHLHTRDILFIKDGFFIVSDLMTPGDENPHTYEQYWHMTPEAKITADTDKKQLRSNFDDGKNVILASADDADIIFKDGYYEGTGGSTEENKAGIFQKTDVTGEATFDTVVLATKYQDGTLDAERIDIGKPATEATALKFKIYENSKETTYYYMRNHKYTEGAVTNFGIYSTDAEVALVGVNEQGAVTDILYVNGSYISENGTDILRTASTVTDISLEATNTRTTIVFSDENLQSDDITAKLGDRINTVMVNGVAKEFENDNGNITVGAETAEEVLVDDDNKHSGVGPAVGTTGNTQGGTAGSAGADNPGGNVTPPSDTPSFNDTASHWAEDDIKFLADKSIVTGDPNGGFRPDSTITRAEFVAIAMRAIGAESKDYQGGFADVNVSDWFTQNLQTAVDIGIISEDVNFRPNDNITREEMAKILTLCAKYLKKAENNSEELSFSDSSSVSAWALEFVEYVSSNGLMNGKDGGIFDPQGFATRAETATVFARLIR